MSMKQHECRHSFMVNLHNDARSIVMWRNKDVAMNKMLYKLWPPVSDHHKEADHPKEHKRSHQYCLISFNHPSISSTHLSLRVAGSLSQLTLGKSRVHPGQVVSQSQRDTHPFTWTFTHTGNLESPVNLTCMTFDCAVQWPAGNICLCNITGVPSVHVWCKSLV